MADVIAIPATAQAALDAGAGYFFVVELALPAAQGGTRRWTSAMRPTVYDGETWVADESPLRAIEFPDAAQNAEGHVAISLFDANGTWAANVQAAGQRGRPVRIVHLLPHGAGLLFPLSTFVGITVEARTVQDRREGRLLRLFVEDALYHSKIVPGEWTSHEFQVGESKRRGLAEAEYDNSHVLANVARKVPWHGTKESTS